MNWLMIVLSMVLVIIVAAIVLARSKSKVWRLTSMCTLMVLMSALVCIGMPLGMVKQNMYEKHDWYIETRLKYAEAEGIEKMYLEMNDVRVYNEWYERNKADLENPWNFKSASGCKFDYIRIKGE